MEHESGRDEALFGKKGCCEKAEVEGRENLESEYPAEIERSRWDGGHFAEEARMDTVTAATAATAAAQALPIRPVHNRSF